MRPIVSHLSNKVGAPGLTWGLPRCIHGLRAKSHPRPLLGHGSSSSTTTTISSTETSKALFFLRPPQAELIRAVASMSRKSGPKRPKDLMDARRMILCDPPPPNLTNLRRQQEALSREIRFGGKSLSSARGTEMHQRHGELGKAISRRRQGAPS
jgi:hypothetical protein